jgi:hypothetical protein
MKDQEYALSAGLPFVDLDGLATTIGDKQQNYSLAVETEISKTAGECRVLSIMAGAIRPSSVAGYSGCYSGYSGCYRGYTLAPTSPQSSD